MPVGAIIGGAALTAGGSVIASSNNSKAIQKSTDSSLQANRETLAAQQKQFDQSMAWQQQAFGQQQGLQRDTYNSGGQLQTDIYNQNVSVLQPWATRGNAAGNQINSMLGLETAANYTPAQITFTPVAAPAAQAGTAAGTPVAQPGAVTQPAGNAPVSSALAQQIAQQQQQQAMANYGTANNGWRAS